MARALAKPVKGTVKFPDEMLLSLLSETKWLNHIDLLLKSTVQKGSSDIEMMNSMAVECRLGG
jgi:hypothetical protein